MKIRNVHERSMVGTMKVAGQLLDRLSGPDDRLWPGDRWPPMKFDLPLCVGAVGGHGLVCYRVSAYDPGRRVGFTFIDSGLTAGMDGGHSFDVTENGERVVIRHVLEAECSVSTWLLWGVIIRPLHDALLEDALDRAEKAMNPSFDGAARWSAWVRVLRSVLKRPKRSQDQRIHHHDGNI